MTDITLKEALTRITELESKIQSLIVVASECCDEEMTDIFLEAVEAIAAGDVFSLKD